MKAIFLAALLFASVYAQQTVTLTASTTASDFPLANCWVVSANHIVCDDSGNNFVYVVITGHDFSGALYFGHNVGVTSTDKFNYWTITWNSGGSNYQILNRLKTLGTGTANSANKACDDTTASDNKFLILGNTVLLKCKITTQDGTETSYGASLANTKKVQFTTTEFTGSSAETGGVALASGTVYSTALTTAVGTASFTGAGSARLSATETFSLFWATPATSQKLKLQLPPSPTRKMYRLCFSTSDSNQCLLIVNFNTNHWVLGFNKVSTSYPATAWAVGATTQWAINSVQYNNNHYEFVLTLTTASTATSNAPATFSASAATTIHFSNMLAAGTDVSSGLESYDLPLIFNTAAAAARGFGLTLAMDGSSTTVGTAHLKQVNSAPMLLSYQWMKSSAAVANTASPTHIILQTSMALGGSAADNNYCAAGFGFSDSSTAKIDVLFAFLSNTATTFDFTDSVSTGVAVAQTTDAVTTILGQIVGGAVHGNRITCTFLRALTGNTANDGTISTSSATFHAWASAQTTSTRDISTTPTTESITAALTFEGKIRSKTAMSTAAVGSTFTATAAGVSGAGIPSLALSHTYVNSGGTVQTSYASGHSILLKYAWTIPSGTWPQDIALLFGIAANSDAHIFERDTTYNTWTFDDAYVATAFTEESSTSTNVQAGVTATDTGTTTTVSSAAYEFSSSAKTLDYIIIRPVAGVSSGSDLADIAFATSSAEASAKSVTTMRVAQLATKTATINWAAGTFSAAKTGDFKYQSSASTTPAALSTFNSLISQGNMSVKYLTVDASGVLASSVVSGTVVKISIVAPSSPTANEVYVYFGFILNSASGNAYSGFIGASAGTGSLAASTITYTSAGALSSLATRSSGLTSASAGVWSSADKTWTFTLSTADFGYSSSAFQALKVVAGTSKVTNGGTVASGENSASAPTTLTPAVGRSSASIITYSMMLLMAIAAFLF